MEDIFLLTKVACQSFILSYVLNEHFNPSIFFSSSIGIIFSDFLMLYKTTISLTDLVLLESFKNT